MTTSEQVRAALAVEWAKFRRARPVWVTTVLLTTGVVAMCVLTLRSVHGADATMAGKAQAIVEDGGRAGLFAAADTIVSVGGLLGFGVVVGWVFGREFTDGAISGLWAAPVSRPAVAAAKLLILLTWSVAVSVATGAALAVAGTFVDDDPLVRLAGEGGGDLGEQPRQVAGLVVRRDDDADARRAGTRSRLALRSLVRA